MDDTTNQTSSLVAVPNDTQAITEPKKKTKKNKHKNKNKHKSKTDDLLDKKDPFELHCISSLPYVPKPITHIVPIPPHQEKRDWTWFVVARESGDLEIYTLDHGEVCLERVIPGGKNKAISSMVYAKPYTLDPSSASSSFFSDQQPATTSTSTSTSTSSSSLSSSKKLSLSQCARLFTGSLNGTVTEWDLDKLVPKFTMDVCLSGVWSLAVNSTSTQLAVGGNTGELVVYDLTQPPTPLGELVVLYQWHYPNHRLLSLVFGPGLSTVVYAGTDRSTVLLFAPHKPTQHLEVNTLVAETDVGKKKKKKKKPKHAHAHDPGLHTSPVAGSEDLCVWWTGHFGPHLLAATSAGTLVVIDTATYTVLHTLPVASVDLVGVVVWGTYAYAATLDGKVAVVQLEQPDHGQRGDAVHVLHTRQWQSHDLRALALVQSHATWAAAMKEGGAEAAGATKEGPVRLSWLVSGGVDSFLHLGDVSKSAASLDKVTVAQHMEFGKSRVHIVTSPKPSDEGPRPVHLFLRLLDQIQLYRFVPSTSSSNSLVSPLSSPSSSSSSASEVPDPNTCDFDPPSTSAPVLRYLSKVHFSPTSTVVDMAVSWDGAWLAVTHTSTHLFRVHAPRLARLPYRFAALRHLTFSPPALHCAAAATATATAKATAAPGVQGWYFAGFDPRTQTVHVFYLTLTTLMVVGVVSTAHGGAFVTHLTFAEHGTGSVLLVTTDTFARVSVYLCTTGLSPQVRLLDWVALEACPITHVAYAPFVHRLLCFQRTAFRCFGLQQGDAGVEMYRVLREVYKGPGIPVTSVCCLAAQSAREGGEERYIGWNAQGCVSIHVPCHANRVGYGGDKDAMAVEEEGSSGSRGPVVNTKKRELHADVGYADRVARVRGLDGLEGVVQVAVYNPGSLIMAMRPTQHLLQTLPPVLMKKKFGKQ